MSISLPPAKTLGFRSPQNEDSRCAGAENLDGIATASDPPEQPSPHPKDERAVPIPIPWRPGQTRIRSCLKQSGQRREPARRKATVKFAEDGQHGKECGPQDEEPGKLDGRCTEQGHARHRCGSLYHRQEPRTRRKAAHAPRREGGRKDATRIEDDAARRVNGGGGGGGNDDNDVQKANSDGEWTDGDNEVILEDNPLADYGPAGEFSKRPRGWSGPGTRTSLLTEGLPLYARLIEDPTMAENVREAIEKQGRFSRGEQAKLQKLVREGEMTKTPMCLKPDGPDWGFDMEDHGSGGNTVFAPAVVPIYLPHQGGSNA